MYIYTQPSTTTMPVKLARRSFNNPYECLKPWPEECGVQAGDDGLVIGGEEGAYMTAFFEAFPTCNGKSTFIRGEGATVEEAEAKAFEKFERANACLHDKGWDRRSYTNGGCFCNGCGMFSSHLEPTTICVVCSVPTNQGTDTDGNWYCKEHQHLIPEDKKTYAQLSLERIRKYMAEKKEQEA